jgi:hypothetical protein
VHLAKLEQRLASRNRGGVARLGNTGAVQRTLLVALLVIPLAAYATTISVPNNFVNGTVAEADEVNTNFATLVTESNDQDLRIGSLEGSIASLDSSKQDRVDDICAPGSSIRVVNLDGTVDCEIDSDTKYTAGTGLNLVGTSFRVDNLDFQERVVGSCPPGFSIRVIQLDGSVICD